MWSNYNKMNIKEEPCFLDTCSENETECFIKDLGQMVKVEISDCDTKPELEEGSTCYSQCHAMGFNETTKESEVETKIDIKAEHCWLQETSCSHDDIKDETHEFCSTKSQGVYEDVSSYTSDLFSSEDLASDISFNMNKDGPECESGSKYQSQKSIVTSISTIETSDCSETPDDGKIVILASSSKQSKFLQKSNTNKQNLNKNHKSVLSHEFRNSYKHEVSEKCSKHKCNICNKTFTRLSNLKNHNLIHEGIRPHKCNVCSKAFTQISGLKRHKLSHEGIKPHSCTICNLGFVDLSQLKSHQLIHEGLNPHNCTICNKAFTNLSNLRSHKLIHEGIKPHKCNICNKGFTHLSTWKKHKVIHEGIKPHKCTICSAAFTQLASLKRHKMVHEGIKPHKCTICDKAFTRLSDLKAHKLMHDGIKPHQCIICNKAFVRLSRLKQHKLIHEGIKAHKCIICNMVFTELSGLQKHKLIH